MSRIKKMKGNSAIYGRVNTCYTIGIVVPFDDYLLQYLASHTDQEKLSNTNFLDSMNSKESIGDIDRYIRYLALGIREPFELKSGSLAAISDGFFKHTWIEIGNYVYDVSFAGKWPKETYYRLFRPQNIVDIDLRTDKYLRELRANLIPSKKKSEDVHLKYVGWLAYTSALSKGENVDSPIFYSFPEDKESMKEKEPQERIIHTEVPLAHVEKVSYKIDPELNIIITEYGAFMGNTQLYINASQEEIEKCLKSETWKEYISMGYKLRVAPSFNNPEFMGVYLENWEEIRDLKGIVPGTLNAEYAFKNREGSILL